MKISFDKIPSLKRRGEGPWKSIEGHSLPLPKHPLGSF